jgi:hypothetical protein
VMKNGRDAFMTDLPVTGRLTGVPRLRLIN